MNKGKICISICATTADELFEKIARAEPLADVIEVRFDCMEPDEIERATDKLSRSSRLWKKLMATFRTREQGGKRDITKSERDHFWNSGNELLFWGADFEEDIIKDSFSWLWDKRICSFHDFYEMPSNQEQTYHRLANTDADVVKMAFQTDEITNAIGLWKLLEGARVDGGGIIPIAMGEAGKWTRILGLAHGAFMTYASLDADGATAPGQITAEDMIDIFRVKELDRETEVFGIIAGDTSYSMSPYIHNPAFKEAGMNRVFVPLQVANLGEFMRRMVKAETREVELNFHGFSVTNPHKQAIIPFLDELDETARSIGAVNTVKIEDGKLYGYNTDAPGFIRPLLDAYGDITDARVAVFGAGGAARACIYSLKQAGADVAVFARDLVKSAPLADEFQVQLREQRTTSDERRTTAYGEFDILINATPIGTKGAAENDTIATAEQLKDVQLIYDLIYNPEETRLIREAKSAGCKTLGGLDMLIGQAVRQFEIWTDCEAPVDQMTEAARKRMER